MKQVRHVFCIAILLLPALAMAAGPTASRFVLNLEGKAGKRLVEASESGPVAPTLVVEGSDAGSCRLVFQLSSLLLEEINIQGTKYSALTIAGGGMLGKVGEPGLPTFSGMLAVPEGRKVEVLASVGLDRVFSDLKVLPVQPDDASTFVLNPDAYREGMKKSQAGTDGDQLVILGEPAIYHGVRVVPFTIKPVAFDPEKSSITVASQLDLEFTFSGRDDRAKSRRTSGPLPESFSGLLQDKIVNWPLAGAESGGKSNDPAIGPGTYLVISPNIPGVVSALRPLIEWRSRQGYTVKHVSTAVSGGSTTQIKSYIQDIYDNAEVPLEFIVLVGDADGPIALSTWHEEISGYSGEGDHYYSMLDGDDILSDVLIGRLSVRNPTELTNIVNKIIGYETVPPLDHDPDWISRASVVGDPSQSGISTVYVSQWLKAQLEGFGFTQVDTIFSGNYPILMMSSLNQGLGAFAYRGFGGMSNFTSAHINNLTNGGKLPFAVFPTCNTGSFHTYSDARCEAFLRHSGGGAIGAIGLSTGGTHTRYNNCLYHGIWEGMLFSGNHTLGAALSRGKLEVYNNYFAAEPHIPEIWSVWTNLMGDPATDMWLSHPGSLVVSHPVELPLGADSVPVTVVSAGEAVSGLRVALFKAGEVTAFGYTDDSGTAVISLPAFTSGTLLVTVTGHDYLPYRGSLALGDVDVYAGLDELQFDDGGQGGMGNGDGRYNPGETLDIRCSLRNLGTDLAAGVSATLSSDDPYAIVSQGDAFFGDIAPGEASWCVGSYQVILAENAPANHEVVLVLEATDGAHSWVSSLPFSVEAAALSVSDFQWGGAGSTLDPGESGSLVLTLVNSGTVESGPIFASLTTESPWIGITGSDGNFANILPGGQGTNIGHEFALTVAGDCFSGHLATLKLETLFAGGAVQTVVFQLVVGTTNSDDPMGPDRYGYYALDNTDIDYTMAPTYNWVEIDPNHGGSGTSVGLTDFGWEQDDTKSVSLPFTFRYYGRQYENISICSNGWLAMGFTTLRHYRNYTIPSAGSPDRLIAPFWDNLNQSGENKVYSWHDADQHRFIIQWSRMPNRQGGQQNFQVILYDPVHYPTPSQDGNILFQYETVQNNDTVNGYATVGIQNTDGTDGLQYSYWNEYAPGAAQLESGRAILFSPLGIISDATCEVSPTAIDITLSPDVQAKQILSVANNGASGSMLQFSLTKVDAGPSAPTAELQKNIGASSMTVSPSLYTPGSTMDLFITVACVSPDSEWIVQVSVDFPDGMVVNSGTDMHSATGSLTYNQATGDGALAIWNNGVILDGGRGTATINLDFTAAVGTVEIPYTLTGDFFGGEPHSVSGVLVLEPAGPVVSVLQPNGGELWAVDDQRLIRFLATGGVETVRIELDRGDGGGWDLIAEDITAAAGSFDWTVTGPISSECLIRISDQSDSLVFDLSNDAFTIGRSLAWLQMDSVFGSIEQGSSQDIELTINTVGLSEGDYAINLVVVNSAGPPVVVPVHLTVSNALSMSPLVPVRLVLEQNHPNPFNPQTRIGFSLPRSGQVSLKVYSTTGRLVRTLIDGILSEGIHQFRWDGTDEGARRVASGVYLYRLETPGEVLSRKLIMVK